MTGRKDVMPSPAFRGIPFSKVVGAYRDTPLLMQWAGCNAPLRQNRKFEN